MHCASHAAERHCPTSSRRCAQLVSLESPVIAATQPLALNAIPASAATAGPHVASVSRENRHAAHVGSFALNASQPVLGVKHALNASSICALVHAPLLTRGGCIGAGANASMLA